MKIHYINIDENYSFNKNVACIGFFDGVHLGHCDLIKKTKEIAKKNNIESSLITFDIDPWTILNNKEYNHITTLEEKLSLIENYDIDNIFLLHFTNSMANLSPIQFINLLKKLNLNSLVCGGDFRFGKKGEGDVNSLKKYFKLFVVPYHLFNNCKISSSTIEKNILNGDIIQANKCLGYKYFIKGKVKHGNKLGTTIGFPTANIDYSGKILPSSGVYLGNVIYKNKKYKAIINIGHNPTINYRIDKSLEVHIINFNQTIYNEEIIISFHKKIRDEKKFNNKDELINQLNLDKQLCILSEDL